MPKHCTLIDPLSLLGVDWPFGLNENGVAIFECIRILAGTVDIKNKYSNRRLRSRNCYLTQKQRRLTNKTISEIINLAFDGDLSTADASRFLAKGSSANREFWEEIKGELCLCIGALHDKKYVDAFVFLYRLLERVSVALPLVYASSEPDFRKAMAFLKALSDNPRDGELIVLHNFIGSVAASGSYRDLEIDFMLTHSDNKWRIEAMRQFKNSIMTEKKVKYKILQEEAGFSIEFASMPSFYVLCRNRLFHNSYSIINFQLDALNGASALCEKIVVPTLYWFSLVLIEIMKAHAKRYV